ncbi:hypothetical protein [Thalassiella azotivora]
MDGDVQTRRRAPRGDTGDIVLGWLTRLVVAFAVLGLVLFDLLSVVTARLSVEDHAVLVARESSERYRATGDLQATYQHAVTVAADADVHDVVPAEEFRVGRDGSVTVTVRRTATTLVTERIGWIDHWATVEARATSDGGR